MKAIKYKEFSLVGLLLTGFLSFLAVSSASALQVETEWLDQFGPVGSDSLSAIDSSENVYVTGSTAQGEALSGPSSFGYSDAFIRKYDSSGNELWTRQFGTSNYERARGVVADASGVYIIGSTTGAFTGEVNKGQTDAYITKYDASGNELWTQQFGTTGDETIWGADIDSGGVYVVGSTLGSFDTFSNLGGLDAFVAKYDANGSMLWLDQFGTDSSDDTGYAVYADDSGVYVGGTTGYDSTQSLGSQNLGGGDAYLRKYNSSGVHQWTEQFGTTDFEQTFAISGYSGGIYVAGETYEAFSGETYVGNGDAFIGKFDTDGNQIWTDQYGSTDYDTTNGLFADSTGVYASGFTHGALPNQTNLGGSDAFIKKYNASGDAIWTYQFGTAQDDQGQRVSVDANSVYMSGRTMGTFPGETNSGDTNIFVAKIFQDDFDSDSIFSAIDSQPAIFSDDYSDGTTTGTIVARGDQVLTVKDAVDVNDGVLASASTAGGAAPAELSSCGGTVTTLLDAGDEVTITCGSAILRTISGTIEATFTADNGTVGTVSLESGNKVTFKPELAIFTADENNVDVVNVAVNGKVVEVTPGEIQPIFISVGIDVKPGNNQNTVNLTANGVIPIAILSTDTFDASTVDPLSVKLNGANVRLKGKSDNIGVLKDIDNDGDLDLVVNIENNLSLIAGDTNAVMKAYTFDGVTVQGNDLLNIVN